MKWSRTALRSPDTNESSCQRIHLQPSRNLNTLIEVTDRSGSRGAPRRFAALFDHRGRSKETLCPLAGLPLSVPLELRFVTCGTTATSIQVAIQVAESKLSYFCGHEILRIAACDIAKTYSRSDG